MFKLTTYTRLIKSAKEAKTARSKGKALEKLCKYVCEMLDGVEVHEVNVHTALKRSIS
jgi:hypothetical protein